jgi:hypothetical protein
MAEQYSSGPLGSTPSFTVPSIVWSISSWTVWVQSPLKVVQLPDFYSLFVWFLWFLFIIELDATKEETSSEGILCKTKFCCV